MTIAFNSEASNYDEWYSTKAGNFIDSIQTKCVFDLLKPQKGMRILDIGCGTGNYSLKLKALGCNVIGVDVSEKMLSVFKAKIEQNKYDIDLHLLQSNILPFEDESFDAIISVTAAEFMDNLPESINEMFRVVKQNCPIVIGTLHKNSKWGEMYESEYFKTNTVFKHAHLLEKSDFKNHHAQQLIGFNESVFFPPNTPEEQLDSSIEEKYKENNNGGFLCVKWIK